MSAPASPLAVTTHTHTATLSCNLPPENLYLQVPEGQTSASCTNNAGLCCCSPIFKCFEHLQGLLAGAGEVAGVLVHPTQYAGQQQNKDPV